MPKLRLLSPMMVDSGMPRKPFLIQVYKLARVHHRIGGSVLVVTHS